MMLLDWGSGSQARLLHTHTPMGPRTKKGASAPAHLPPAPSIPICKIMKI